MDDRQWTMETVADYGLSSIVHGLTLRIVS